MNKNVQGHIFALTANILWGLVVAGSTDDGGHRQIRTYGVFSLIGNYVPHGRCSRLFLATVCIL